MGLNSNPSQPAYLIPGLPSAMGNSKIISTDSSGNLAVITPGAGIATFLATPTSANLAAAVVTSSTGSGALVFGTSPTFTTSAIFPTGTEAAPGITFTGATNTGIFSPALGAVSITTAGTERLRVTSTGSVGIGLMTTPVSLLSVGGINGNDTTDNCITICRFTDGRGSALISSYRTDLFADTFHIAVDGANPVDLTKTKYRADASGVHIWYGATTASERMRITASGNIHTPAGATGMTAGFFYMPSADGAPTGVPTAITGTVPFYYDTTNNYFYVYNGGWKKVQLA